MSNDQSAHPLSVTTTINQRRRRRNGQTILLHENEDWLVITHPKGAAIALASSSSLIAWEHDGGEMERVISDNSCQRSIDCNGTEDTVISKRI